MIILVGNWKRKIFNFLKVIIIVLAFVMVLPFIAGSLANYVPVFSSWFEEEHPTGNPMRVENQESATKFDKMLDSFVFHLQDFYYEE